MGILKHNGNKNNVAAKHLERAFEKPLNNSFNGFNEHRQQIHVTVMLPLISIGN